MPEHGRRRRSPARLIAPLALLVVAGAIGYVVSTSARTGDDDDDSPGRTVQQRPREDERPQKRRRQRSFYTVKLNDTLGLIAQKTDVPVERLEDLNPDLDPQNLIVGQRIRLRE